MWVRPLFSFFGYNESLRLFTAVNKVLRYIILAHGHVVDQCKDAIQLRNIIETANMARG